MHSENRHTICTTIFALLMILSSAAQAGHDEPYISSIFADSNGETILILGSNFQDKYYIEGTSVIDHPVVRQAWDGNNDHDDGSGLEVLDSSDEHIIATLRDTRPGDYKITVAHYFDDDGDSELKKAATYDLTVLGESLLAIQDGTDVVNQFCMALPYEQRPAGVCPLCPAEGGISRVLDELAEDGAEVIFPLPNYTPGRAFTVEATCNPDGSFKLIDVWPSYISFYVLSQSYDRIAEQCAPSIPYGDALYSFFRKDLAQGEQEACYAYIDSLVAE